MEQTLTKTQLDFVFVDGRASDGMKDRRARRLLTNVQLPMPLLDVWDEPDQFHEALSLHMRRHGDNSERLHRALTHVGMWVDCKTIRTWRCGEKAPHSESSFKALEAIEERYRLGKEYLRAKLCTPGRSVHRARIEGVSRSESAA